MDGLKTTFLSFLKYDLDVPVVGIPGLHDFTPEEFAGISGIITTYERSVDLPHYGILKLPTAQKISPLSPKKSGKRWKPAEQLR